MLSGVLVVLLLLLLPQFKTLIQPYMFIRSATQYYRPLLMNYDLAPGDSLVQKIHLDERAIKIIRLFLNQPVNGTVNIKVSGNQNGAIKKVFDKDYKNFKGKRLDLDIETVLFKDKTVILQVTNISQKGNIVFPVRLKNIHQKGFLLAIHTTNEKEQLLEKGVLPLEIIEAPLFLKDSQKTIRDILSSLYREKGFIVFWLLLLILCYAKTLKFYRLCRQT